MPLYWPWDLIKDAYVCMRQTSRRRYVLVVIFRALLNIFCIFFHQYECAGVENVVSYLICLFDVCCAGVCEREGNFSP